MACLLGPGSALSSPRVDRFHRTPHRPDTPFGLVFQFWPFSAGHLDVRADEGDHAPQDGRDSHYGGQLLHHGGGLMHSLYPEASRSLSAFPTAFLLCAAFMASVSVVYIFTQDARTQAR